MTSQSQHICVGVLLFDFVDGPSLRIKHISSHDVKAFGGRVWLM